MKQTTQIARMKGVCKSLPIGILLECWRRRRARAPHSGY